MHYFNQFVITNKDSMEVPLEVNIGYKREVITAADPRYLLEALCVPLIKFFDGFPKITALAVTCTTTYQVSSLWLHIRLVLDHLVSHLVTRIGDLENLYPSALP